jgi:hypothetical protein
MRGGALLKTDANSGVIISVASEHPEHQNRTLLWGLLITMTCFASSLISILFFLLICVPPSSSYGVALAIALY